MAFCTHKICSTTQADQRNSTASRQAPLFFSRPPDRKSFYGFKDLPDLAIREGNWKLLCDYDGGRPELYNLAADPGEAKNEAENHPALLKELSQKLLNWYAQMPQLTP